MRTNGYGWSAVVLMAVTLAGCGDDVTGVGLTGEEVVGTYVLFVKDGQPLPIETGVREECAAFLVGGELVLELDGDAYYRESTFGDCTLPGGEAASTRWEDDYQGFWELAGERITLEVSGRDTGVTYFRGRGTRLVRFEEELLEIETDASGTLTLIRQSPEAWANGIWW